MVFVFGISSLFAQDLTVPDAILKEMKTEVFVGEDSLVCRVVYPENYNAKKSYPVLLGLSGGGQSEKIVNYCYAAWFKSALLKDYITIMPQSKAAENLREASPEKIQDILEIIQSNFKTKKGEWIIAGTSNGGLATFKFVAANPALYEGIIVMPGGIGAVEADKSWNHLKVILAYGDQDSEGWIIAATATEERLKDHVKEVVLMPLKGQGHLLPIDFDIDMVYRKYMEMK